MNIGRMFASAVVRHIVFFGLALLFAVIVTGLCAVDVRAEAVWPGNVIPACSTIEMCDRGEAWAACRAESSTFPRGATPPAGTIAQECTDNGVNQVTWYYYGFPNFSGPHQRSAQYHACVLPAVWNEEKQICHDPQRCLDKSNLGGGVISANESSACIDGCEYSGAGQGGGTTLSFNGGAFVSSTKGWGPTGFACTDADFDPEKQECMQLPHGQTACARPDGKHCFSGASGPDMSQCWSPGETGEKSNGPDMQKTNAGPESIPPNLSLPSGDSLVPVGQPVVTNITNTTNGANNSTTTTTNNFTTVNGTNAGGGPGKGDTGQTTGGTGTVPGSGSDGEGDGDGFGSITGGNAECTAPPVCTGGDPLICAGVQQAYMARCESKTLLQKYLDEPFDPTDMGTGDFVLGDLFKDSTAVEGDELDEGGFGWARACPAPPQVFGTVMDLDGLCSIMQMIGVLVLAMGALHSVYILRGG